MFSKESIENIEIIYLHAKVDYLLHHENILILFVQMSEQARANVSSILVRRKTRWQLIWWSLTKCFFLSSCKYSLYIQQRKWWKLVSLTHSLQAYPPSWALVDGFFSCKLTSLKLESLKVIFQIIFSHHSRLYTELMLFFWSSNPIETTSFSVSLILLRIEKVNICLFK